MEPDPLDELVETPAPASRRGVVRLLALVLWVGLVVALALAVGWNPAAGLASAWNQVTHPPFTTAERQELTTLATHAAASSTNQITITIGSLRAVQVTLTLDWNAEITSDDVAQEQARVEVLCFQVQKAIWSSALSPSDVLVIILGPVTDEYAQPTIDAHGSAELSEKTASSLSWSLLTPDRAWTKYDHAYLRPSYRWYLP